MATRGTYADIGWGFTVTWNSDTLYGMSVEFGGFETDIVEKTHSGSTEAWKEFIAGLKDAGDITLELNHDPDFVPVQGSSGTLVVTFPVPSGMSTGATCTVTAILQTFSPSVPNDDKMTTSITWKITGKPVFAAAA